VTWALERFGGLGFDVALLGGADYCERLVDAVGREAILNVLGELSLRDAGVRRRLAGLRSVYPKHEEFMLKLSALDAAGLAAVLKRLSFLAQVKVYLFWKRE
jgi:hypothetical protein